MKPSADSLILSLIAALSIAAAAVVATGSLTERSRGTRRGFQQALGGLGLGCQVDLARSPWQFDPRLSADDDGLGMIAGLGQLSPWNAMALFPFAAGTSLPQE